MKTGRPSLYSPQLAAQIIARLAGGLSLERLCRNKQMPSASTIYRWLGERADFREAYVRAGEAKGIRSGERVVDIAERCLRGEIPPDAARVAIEGHKWAAGRLAPKVYGDRVALTDPNGEAFGTTVVQARHDLESKLARLAGKDEADGVPQLAQ
jgi:hypothetical protein